MVLMKRFRFIRYVERLVFEVEIVNGSVLWLIVFRLFELAFRNEIESVFLISFFKDSHVSFKLIHSHIMK